MLTDQQPLRTFGRQAQPGLRAAGGRPAGPEAFRRPRGAPRAVSGPEQELHRRLQDAARTKEWWRVEPALQDARERGLLLSAETYRLAVAASRTRWQQAQALFEEMRSSGLTPTVMVANACISAYERGQQWDKALALLEEMPAMGLQPTVVSYSAAVAACARCGQWKPALRLLAAMEQRGLAPDVICISSVMSACERSKQWEAAVELLASMPQRGLQPDVICYNTAISACGKGRQCERALALLDQMESEGLQPDIISFNAALAACQREEQPNAIVSLLYRARNLGLVPTKVTAVVARAGVGSRMPRELSHWLAQRAPAPASDRTSPEGLRAAATPLGAGGPFLRPAGNITGPSVARSGKETPPTECTSDCGSCPSRELDSTAPSACRVRAPFSTKSVPFARLPHAESRPPMAIAPSAHLMREQLRGHLDCQDWRAAVALLRDMRAAGCPADDLLPPWLGGRDS